MSSLRLDMSVGKEAYDTMGATYRNEGLSVGSDHMRLYGEEIQLEVSFHDLILGNRIGQGACSSVNLAKHKRTAETYAIKMFNVYDKGQASQLYNEILLLTSFQCDALISLKGAFHDEGSIGVILEYMDRGSLEFLCDDRLEVSEQVMAAIAFQICWGLGYLHYEKQIHRDVKPGNMLMTCRETC
ncbi:kinase-like domain-containing protein [Ochromonadaceae sp. CCMP2298]|nr:kinase-like domain-containing protein [Ochromonadaceae sp. CCMP2298]